LSGKTKESLKLSLNKFGICELKVALTCFKSYFFHFKIVAHKPHHFDTKLFLFQNKKLTAFSKIAMSSQPGKTPLKSLHKK
jgi:hypothetical protein